MAWLPVSPRAYWVAGSLLLLVSLVVRALSYSVQTSDYIYYVSKWCTMLKSTPGLTAFLHPFSDYAPLYLYLLKPLAFVPVSTLYSTKTVSVLFEILAAAIAVRLLRHARPEVYERPERRFVAFALFLCVPTLLLNSSLWGQADALYAAGVIASLYFLILDRPLAATLAFALGICVKVQAVFFLPILAGYLLQKSGGWRYLALVPLVYVLLIIPAWMGGGSFGDLLFVYLRESGEYPYLSVSAQSIFAFANGVALTPGATSVLFWMGILAALAAAMLVIVYIKHAPQVLAPRQWVFISLASVLLLPYLLPRMHERYFYLADLFAVLYALLSPREWFIAVAVVVASLLSYLPYLGNQTPLLAPVRGVDLRVPSLLLLVVVSYVAYALWQSYRANISK